MSMSQGSRRRPAAPLYEARFEHDACGVGFVADAGGRSRERVLPLALAGLAALGHRGAFGADGESSDGAGVALPLDRSLLRAAGRRGRRGTARDRLALPAARPRRRATRAGARRGDLRRGRPAVAAWRAVPVDIAALGTSAAASRPAFAHAIVARPSRGEADPRPMSDDAFERRLVIARRRLETAARAAGGALAELAVPSASARTIVYKGLVIGGRLPDLYPDLRAPLSVGYAVFHQRYATNTHPVWRLAQPFRSIAHNGEINTVRGNREQVRGRAADPATSRGRPGAAGGRPAAVRGRLRLALARRGARAPDRDRLGPDAGAADRHPRGARAAPRAPSARRHAPPPDGRVPRAVGRSGGDRLRRRPAGRRAGRSERAAAGGVRGDPRPARRGRLGGRRRARSGAAETIRRGRLGPGELLLVEPGRRAIMEDAEAKTLGPAGAADP